MCWVSSCVREVGKLDPYLRNKGWLWCPSLSRDLLVRIDAVALALWMRRLVLLVLFVRLCFASYCFLRLTLRRIFWYWNWDGQGESDCLLETKQRDFAALPCCFDML